MFPILESISSASDEWDSILEYLYMFRNWSDSYLASSSTNTTPWRADGLTLQREKNMAVAPWNLARDTFFRGLNDPHNVDRITGQKRKRAPCGGDSAAWGLQADPAVSSLQQGTSNPLSWR